MVGVAVGIRDGSNVTVKVGERFGVVGKLVSVLISGVSEIEICGVRVDSGVVAVPMQALNTAHRNKVNIPFLILRMVGVV